jgi:predicted RNA-binding protein with PUA-like domain|tara:strand:+ start:3169 stop:3585 length:417 start_codon:yes stop_codon:yes gene_type:complete
MKYWLVKTEPSTWSWEDQIKNKETFWDGVRNWQASNNLKQMKIGDLVFFYHSVNEKMIVGIVKVSKEYYPDHTDKSKRFGMVNLRFFKTLKKSVSLSEIKSRKDLAHLSLVRQSRLSVMPIDSKSWEIICKMAKTKTK